MIVSKYLAPPFSFGYGPSILTAFFSTISVITGLFTIGTLQGPDLFAF